MITDKEKIELALKKIEQFEYGYSSKLEKNIMITLFVDGFNEAERQIKNLSLGNVIDSVCVDPNNDCRFLIPKGKKCDYIYPCKHKKQTEL